jgi:hypothetical protein
MDITAVGAWDVETPVTVTINSEHARAPVP